MNHNDISLLNFRTNRLEVSIFYLHLLTGSTFSVNFIRSCSPFSSLQERRTALAAGGRLVHQDEHLPGQEFRGSLWELHGFALCVYL